MTENEAIRILGDTTLFSPLGQAAFVGIEAIKKLQQYRAIGTVEECREAVEKQRAKKPILSAPCKSINYYLCPNCGKILPINKPFCSECGSAVDWRDTP